jgi:hypothetical protein
VALVRTTRRHIPQEGILKEKLNFSLSLTKPGLIKTYGEEDLYIHAFFISAPVGGE